jgi:hypothetical protein
MSQDRQEIGAATTETVDDADDTGHAPVVAPGAPEAVGSWRRLQGWSGIALMAGGVLLPLATLLHPGVETADTIIASEARLVAAHVLFTVSWVLVLFGLPGLYAAQRTEMGRLGSAGSWWHSPALTCWPSRDASGSSPRSWRGRHRP